MSEAPETIWPDHIWVNEKGEVYQRRTYDGDVTGYRRAGLPPTLSAAMELPEIKAMVDLKGFDLLVSDAKAEALACEIGNAMRDAQNKESLPL